MTAVTARPEIIRDAPIETWFGVGGRADRLALPESVEEVAWCVRNSVRRRVLGDGANLLVADEGVDGLVIDLERMSSVSLDRERGRVRAEGGANLPRLITETAREGLSGLEVLAGIPATVGGAAVMNAGGKFGSIADVIDAVEVVDDAGAFRRIERREIAYGYRRSGLRGIVVAVDFTLTPGDPAAVRTRLKECMAYKKSTQPLSADSAGCCFRNPTLTASIDGIGGEGERVSAGLLLDRAGCKGLRRGGAVVSTEHANFIVAEAGASAADVIALLGDAAERVRDAFGVEIEREVVIWRREGEPSACRRCSCSREVPTRNGRSVSRAAKRSPRRCAVRVTA